MRSEAHWTSGALRQLLDTKQAERILRAVTQFERSGAGDVKKLSGESNQWRMRVGDWRVFFARAMATSFLSTKSLTGRMPTTDPVAMA